MTYKLKNCYLYEGDILGWPKSLFGFFCFMEKPERTFWPIQYYLTFPPFVWPLHPFWWTASCRTMLRETRFWKCWTSPGPSFQSSEHEDVTCSKSHNKSVSSRAGAQDPGDLSPKLAWFFCAIVSFSLVVWKLNGLIQIKPTPQERQWLWQLPWEIS